MGIEAIIINLVLSAVISYALSAVTTAILGGPKAAGRAGGTSAAAPPDLVDALQTTVDPSGPLPCLFGRRRVGGRVLFNNKKGDATYMVILLAGAPITGLNGIYINNKKVTLDVDGDVQSAPWYSSKDDVSSINIKFYDGTQTVSDPVLNAAFTEWDANTIGRKLAMVRIKIRPVPRDSFSEAYQGGMPDFTFDINGFACYDPRTNAHAHTENAALHSANYIIHECGMAEPFDTVNWGVVASDANVCDELVATLGDAEPRYRCSAVWRTDMRHEDVLNEIGATMAGGVIPVGGKYETWVGHYVPPLVTADFDESHLAEDGIEVANATPIESLINGVRGTFTSSLDNWEERDFPAYINAAARAEDGREILGDLKLAFVTSASQAQRLAKINFMFTRHGTPASMHAKLDCLDTTVGDMIYMTEPLSGLNRQTFRVYSEEFSGEDFTLRYQLIREDASFYAYSAIIEENPYTGFANDPDFADQLAPPGFTITATTVDGANAAYITPALNANSGLDYYQAEYKLSTSGEWITLGTTTATTGARFLATNLGANGSIWNFRLRSIRNGTGSDWTETQHIVGGGPSTVTGSGADAKIYVASVSRPTSYVVAAPWVNGATKIELYKTTKVTSPGPGGTKVASYPLTKVAESTSGSPAAYTQTFGPAGTQTLWKYYATIGGVRSLSVLTGFFENDL